MEKHYYMILLKILQEKTLLLKTLLSRNIFKCTLNLSNLFSPTLYFILQKYYLYLFSNLKKKHFLSLIHFVLTIAICLV